VLTKNSSNKTTRGWNADKNQTFLQREKEGSADYRYFPEPDIPPIIFNKEQIEEIRQSFPVLPDEKIAQYKLLGLSDYDAFILADTKESAEIFDKIISIESSREFAKFSANLLTGPLKTIKIDINKINPDYFKKLFDHKLDFSSTVIKQLILDSYQTGLDPLEIAKEKNLFQVSDTNTLEQFAKEVIEANPKAVEDYHQNPLAIGFLVGQLMKVSKGSANPQTGKEILEKLLK